MLTKRQSLIVAGVIALILIVIAIGAYFWRSDQLAYKPAALVAEEQAEWNRLAIQNYTITVEYKSLPFDFIQYDLTVENGEMTTAECVDVRREEPCEERFIAEDYTVDALFAKASELAKRHGGDVHFNIIFEPKYHFPQRFGIYTEDVADSGRSWAIVSFAETK